MRSTLGGSARMPILVIAAYHCEVAGDPTDSVDYQVRYFAADSIDEVMAQLRAESPQTYKNAGGQEVRWIFERTVAVEFDPDFTDGTEVIGFITGRPREITEPDATPKISGCRGLPTVWKEGLWFWTALGDPGAWRCFRGEVRPSLSGLPGYLAQGYPALPCWANFGRPYRDLGNAVITSSLTLKGVLVRSAPSDEFIGWFRCRAAEMKDGGVGCSVSINRSPFQG
jgi:hypothetical protein